MALPLLPILLLGGAGVALLALSKSGNSSGAAAPEPLTKSKGPAGTPRGGYTYKDDTSASQAAAVKALADAYKNQGGYIYHQDTSASQAATLAAQARLDAAASRDEQATRIDDKKASDYAGNPDNYQTGPAPDQGLFPSASSADYPMSAEEQAMWADLSLKSRQGHAAHPESDPCRCECHHWLTRAIASGRRVDLEPLSTDFGAGPDPMPMPRNCVAIIPPDVDADKFLSEGTFADWGCRDGSAYAKGFSNITAAQFAAFDKKSGC